MQFNTLVFAVFFAVVLLLHNLPLSWRIRKFNLLWLSYLFYAAWNPPFVVLLWISTVADWFIARWIHRSQSTARRRGLLLLSIVVNLGMLSYFKYGKFAVESMVALLDGVGVDFNPAAPDIALPIGISFYTFQTLSYTLDIYAKRIKPWSSFLDYALFVTFFPQLVAGPIVRARHFLPQCITPPKVSASQFAWGLYLVVLGLFEKTVIADALLAPAVETVFDSSSPPSAIDGWVGSMAFAGQVFCDFAGYSTCAIGVALCLGFRLPINFRFPLAAVGFAEFWRRWHISLSTWARDYVYHPLGGDRVTFLRFMFNVMLTWALIGLWHGAAWRFVLWGLISGVYVVVERALCNAVPQSPLWTKTPVQFSFACIQFVGFSISLLVFRAPNFERLFALGGPMFSTAPVGDPMLLTTSATALTFGTVMALFLSHWFLRDSSLEQLADNCPWFLKSAALAVMLAGIVLAPGGDRAFIYFQF